MIKKAINLKETSFTQAINISAQWCKEWGEDLLSEEVLADRVAELIKTKNGLRGFFAYALSDQNCYLLDKLPFSLVFKLQEAGNYVVEIVIKNLIMSSAQIVVHDRENNIEYKSNSSSKNAAVRTTVFTIFSFIYSLIIGLRFFKSVFLALVR